MQHFASRPRRLPGERSRLKLPVACTAASLAALLALAFAGCSDDSSYDACTSCGPSNATGGSAGADSGSGGDTSSAGSSGTGGSDGIGGSSDPGDPPAEACEPTLELVDTTTPDHVVGTGTKESCTSQALVEAATQGGIVTFDCGAEPHTIVLEEGIHVPTDKDTVIDGGGTIELDGDGKYRHFTFNSPGWQTNQNKLVIERIVLRNGLAPLGEYFPPVDNEPDCAYGYKEGSGGAVYMRDGVLQVIDSEFYDNQAALIGPDVGGGAIYAQGVSGVTISGSVFKGNRASNGGAVGMLFANPLIENSLFEDNTAEGVGQNTAGHGQCPEFGHAGQGGAGGLAGAVYFDGMNADDFVYTICGSIFRNNRANELAGALFRTPNVSVREMLIDRSLFDGNTALVGGVSFIKQNDLTVRASSFLHNRAGLLVDGTNVGGPIGGLWVNEGTVDLENSTFFDNLPTGLIIEGTGTVKNATFFESDVNGSVDFDNSLFVDTECSDLGAGTGNVAFPDDGGCVSGATIDDPELVAPADNGGPTPTCLPSASVVSGKGSSCPAEDQRGETRDAASCAAGAVEP